MVNRWIFFRFPGRTRDSPLFHSVTDKSVIQKIKAFRPKGKRLGREADHSPPSRTEVMSERSNACSPTLIHGVQRDDLTIWLLRVYITFLTGEQTISVTVSFLFISVYLLM
jgi:hypothetical protein